MAMISKRHPGTDRTGTRECSSTSYMRSSMTATASPASSSACASATTLREFNLRWSRRTLSQERDHAAHLRRARRRCRRRADKADRGQHKPCRKADLAQPAPDRYEGFEARPASGVAMLSSHMEELFLLVHNEKNLVKLTEALKGSLKHRRAA